MKENHTKNNSPVIWVVVGIFIGTVVIVLLGIIILWRNDEANINYDIEGANPNIYYDNEVEEYTPNSNEVEEYTPNSYNYTPQSK